MNEQKKLHSHLLKMILYYAAKQTKGAHTPKDSPIDTSILQRQQKTQLRKIICKDKRIFFFSTTQDL